jgi:hypothetical protein
MRAVLEKKEPKTNFISSENYVHTEKVKYDCCSPKK